MAAVAGPAAVAVVQSVVGGGTAESVVSHSARQELAELAALSVRDMWRARIPASDSVGGSARGYISGVLHKSGAATPGGVDLCARAGERGRGVLERQRRGFWCE